MSGIKRHFSRSWKKQPHSDTFKPMFRSKHLQGDPDVLRLGWLLKYLAKNSSSKAKEGNLFRFVLVILVEILLSYNRSLKQG